MKRTIFIITLLASLFVHAQAQTEMRLSVCVGDDRLEDLLTDEQKDNVTHLTITGTMQEEDYGFIRTNRMTKIIELNLRDADIEVIPPHAFDFKWYQYYYTAERTVILPKTLTYLSDYSLCLSGYCCTFVLTGAYPKLGKNVYYSKDNMYSENITVVPSEDNHLFYIDSESEMLYSSDNTIMYLNQSNFVGDIKEGTRIINGGAFENQMIDVCRCVMPETVDSIGDRAFANLYLIVTSNGDFLYSYIKCLSAIPPKLGEDVFVDNVSYGFFYNVAYLFVPDESVETYKATEGWNTFQNIFPLSSFEEHNHDNIKAVNKESRLNICDDGERIMISAQCLIKSIVCYNTVGQIQFSQSFNNNVVYIDKRYLTAPYVIARISYDDGMSETIKLKP